MLASPPPTWPTPQLSVMDGTTLLAGLLERFPFSVSCGGTSCVKKGSCACTPGSRQLFAFSATAAALCLPHGCGLPLLLPLLSAPLSPLPPGSSSPSSPQTRRHLMPPASELCAEVAHRALVFHPFCLLVRNPPLHAPPAGQTVPGRRMW